MGAHGSSAAVQEQGCKALCILSFNADNRVAIVAMGGIEAVVGAMAVHGSSAGVQEKGCSALSNLAVNTGNEMAIAAKGGIEAVVRAMEAHESSAGVQEKAISSLDNICWTSSALRSHVREAGALPLVFKAMSAFPGDLHLQQRGKALLNTLGEWVGDSVGNSDVVGNSDGW
jgi:hypothetical protein